MPFMQEAFHQHGCGSVDRPSGQNVRSKAPCTPPRRINTALQRTRSASLRSPLSFEPLAATEGACVASREPVTRPSLVVREGQEMNGVGGFEIDHMVREASDRRLAHREIF